ncbi:MAG: hotdog fold thioesterase [Bacteroidota bacterium]|nr:hotdog fold thioesterase [Bacteroidota bacterium]
MAIWFDKEVSPALVNEVFRGTLPEFLQMECTEVGEDFMKMKMPVTSRTLQPLGILHGGASCALAETIGSVSSHLAIDRNQYFSAGLEINANHIRTVKDGEVTATCVPLHLGRNTHVWDIRITDTEDRLVCVCRLTVAIISLKKAPGNVISKEKGK